MSGFLVRNRVVGFVALLVGSWCVMTWTHEAGHLVAGWCCGGQLQVAEVRPWRLPYSVFSPDPQPLVTLWCGPLLGVCVPVLVALIVNRAWVWFIAQFCVLANGLYLATAWFAGDAFLDTAQLLKHGANPLWIVLFCVLTIVSGYIGFKRSCVAFFCSRQPGGTEADNDAEGGRQIKGGRRDVE